MTIRTSRQPKGITLRRRRVKTAGYGDVDNSRNVDRRVTKELRGALKRATDRATMRIGHDT